MKIGIRTFLKDSVLAVFSAAFVFAFSSCEIGLGAAVDTMAPVVKSIDSPAQNSARNGSIEVTGTCEDDTGMSHLLVTLKSNANDSEVYDLGEIEPESKGPGVSSWKFNLEYDKTAGEYVYAGKDGEQRLSLKDGTYILEVLAVDGSGRKSQRLPQTFDIDNTPPVFLLSSPNSLTLEAPTLYGRTITLKGTISDDHPSTDKESVTVQLFRKGADGNPGEEIEGLVQEFNVADTSNVTVVFATYAGDNATPTGSEQINYDKAYTQTYNQLNPEQQYFLSIKVRDNTVGPDGKPLENESTYIRDKLISLTKSSDSPNLNVTANLEGSDFKDIWSGTYTGELSEIQQTEIRNILDGKYVVSDSALECIGNEAKPYAINVNKDASPTYSLNFPISANTTPFNFNKTGNDSELTFNVKKGRDKANVVPSSIGVKVYDFGAVGPANVEAIENKFRETPVWECNSTVSPESLYKDESGVKQLLKDIETSTEDATYTVKLPGMLESGGIVMGHYYIIKVEGRDTAGIDLEPIQKTTNEGTSYREYFGFYTATSGTPPSLDSNVNREWVKYAGNSSTGYPFEILVTETMAEGSSYKNNNDKQYLKVHVKRYDGYLSSVPLNPSFDDDFVYGDLSHDGGSANQFKEVVTLPGFSAASGSNYTYHIRVEASNVAGDTSKDFLYYVDNGDPGVSINVPDSLSSNSSVIIDETDPNWNRTRGTYKLGWVVNDDGSGITSYGYELTKDGETFDAKDEKVNKAGNISMTSEIANVSECLGLTLKLWAKDYCGNTKEITRTIGFDSSVPTISITKSPVSDKPSKERVQFDISAQDSLAMQTLTITAKRGTFSTTASSPTNGVTFGDAPVSGGKTMSRTLVFDTAAADGEWTITVSARDSAGRESTKETSLIFDATEPLIHDDFKVEGASRDSYQYNANNNYFSLSTPAVKVTVDEPSSGLSKLYYLVTRKSVTPTTDLSKWKSMLSSEKGSGCEISISASGYSPTAAGDYDVLHVIAEDRAGNKSAQKDFNIVIDMNPPAFSYDFYKVNGNVFEAAKTIYRKSSVPVTLYGNVSDAETGLQSVNFFDKNTELKYSSSTLSKASIGGDDSTMDWKNYSEINPVNIKSWRAVFNPSETSVDVSAQARDLAGMPGNEIALCTIKKDDVAPVLSDLSLSDNAKITESSLVSKGDGVYSLNVSGKWSDNLSGTAKLEYKVGDGDAWQDVTQYVATNVTTPADWHFTIDVAEGKNQSIGFRFTDNAGNSNTTTVSGLIFDTSTPTLTTDPNPISEVYSTVGGLVSNKASMKIIVEDALELGTITVEAVKDGTVVASGSSGYTLTNSLLSNTKHIYTLTFTAGADKADGEWTVNVSGADIAGKPISGSYKFVVDGTKPVIDGPFKVKDEAWSEGKYFNNEKLKFEGSVMESVGMGKVYYLISDSSTTPGSIVSDPDVKTASLSGLTFYATDDFAVPGKYLYMQAVDAAGNPGIVEPKRILLDKTAPEFAVTHYANGGDVVPLSGGSTKLLTNGNSDFTVYGTYTDDASGVGEIDILAGGASVKSNFTVTYTDVNVAENALAEYTGWKELDELDAKNVRMWRAVISKEILSSEENRAAITGKAISVKTSDKAGNGKTENSLFTLDVDSIKPSISNLSIKASNSGKSDGYKSSDTLYYVAGRSYVLTGTSTDNNEVKSTVAVLTKEGGSPVTLTNSGNDKKWEFPIDFSSYTDTSSATLVVTTTDKAGNTDEKNLTVKVDTASPELLKNEFKANYTYKGQPVYKDHMFRIGGGQYSESSFTNKTSLPVVGYYKEAGSGIAKLYYQICHSSDTPMGISDYAAKANGVILGFEADDATERPKDPVYGEQEKYKLIDEATKELSIIGGRIDSEQWPSSTYYRFEEVLNGFSPMVQNASGNYVGDTLYLIAVDNCGNVAAPRSFKINVDQSLNDFKLSDTSGDAKLTNGNGDIVLEGTATDDLAGLEMIEFEVGSGYKIPAYDLETALNSNGSLTEYLTTEQNGKTYASYGKVRFYASNGADSYSETCEKIDYYKSDSGVWSGAPANGGLPSLFMQNGPTSLKWSLTITASDSWFTSSNLGTNPVVYANVKDYAGNTYRHQVAVLKLDENAPETRLLAPVSDGTPMNGTFDVMGDVSDENLPKTVCLYKYKGNTPSSKLSDWTLVGGFTTANVSKDPMGNDTAMIKANQDVSKIYYCSFTGFNMNSEFITGDSATGSGYLMLVACDEAGNWNVDKDNITPDKYSSYSVDLNTDRPEIRFSEITNNGANENSMYTSKYSSQIGGTISDDDGIKVLKISPTEKPDDVTWESYWESYEQKGTLTYGKNEKTVTFSYTPEGGTDGVKNLYFYVEDVNGAKFWTSHGTSWMQPTVRYAGASVSESLASVVSYRTDSNPPVSIVSCGYGESASDAEDMADAEIRDGATMEASMRFGGTKRAFVTIAVAAKDANGITSVKGHIGEGADILFDTNSENNSITVNGDVYRLYTKTFAMAEAPEGQTVLNVTVTDTPGLEAKTQVPMFIDCTGPDVNVTTSSTLELKGIVEVQGTTSDLQGSDVEKLWCFIPNDDFYDSINVLKSDYGTSENNYAGLRTYMRGKAPLASGSVLSWKAVFETPTTATNPPSLISKLPTSQSELGKYSKFTNTNGVYTLPVYVLASDGLGNETLITSTIQYNPFGDRPTAQVMTPVIQTGSFSASASGNIRVSGTATDNVSVSKVYVQIALGHSDLKDSEQHILDMGRETWEASVISNIPGYTVVTRSDLDPNGTKGELFAADPTFWGIDVGEKVTNWSLIINRNANLQTTDSADSLPVTGDTTYTIWVRAAAMDNNGLLGAWSTPRAISINPKAPAIEQAPVVRLYEDAAYQTLIAEKPYSADMYVKGYARLEGITAEHVNGIDEISYTRTSGGSSMSEILVRGGAAQTSNANATVSSSSGVFTVAVPITTGNSGSGDSQIVVRATEGSDAALSAEQTYTFHYDNTAPVIQNLTANGADFIENSKLRNSNMQLTLGGTVKDADSGFDKLLFAFYRSSNKILNTQELGSGGTPQSIGLSGLDSESIDGVTIWGKIHTATWTDETTISLTAADLNIRAGGVVRVNGSWYVITNVSSDGKTVNISGGVSDKNAAPTTGLFFPYMQVVDNTGSETVQTWSESGHLWKDGKKDNDDMLESVSRTDEETWTWDAVLHGNFMKDGPVEFVVLAIDKAGNVSATKREASVENNPPRLAKVYLGTDLNSDSKFSDTEFEVYDILGVTSMAQEAYDLKTEHFSTVAGSGTTAVVEASDRSAFKVKNKLAIYPEFVGGNGDVKMVLARLAADLQTTVTEDGETVTYPAVQKGSGAALRGLSTAEFDGNTKVQSGYVLSNKLLALGSDLEDGQSDDSSSLELSHETHDGKKCMSFSFWDSTDDTTCGENSQSCVLRITDLMLDLVDTKAPTSVIEPLYWRSESDNSLYLNSKANGHIELEADWKTEGTTYNSEATEGLTDGDPKISGKVTFTGYAYDDRILSYLYVGFGGKEFAACLTNAQGNMTMGSGANTVYALASYENGSWHKNSASLGTEGWELTVSDVYFNQNGHKVRWTLSLDTEKMLGTPVAGLDKILRVRAADRAGKLASETTNSDEGDGVENKTVYQMDVVPYILGLKTSLSSKTGSSVYDRTALGHYPINKDYGETLTGDDTLYSFYVYGFNIAGGTLKVVKNMSTSGEVISAALGGAKSFGTQVVYPVTKADAQTLYSGKFSVDVSGVSSINNMNNNDAKGAYSNNKDYTESELYKKYSNYPNRFPDKLINNRLTDDMELDVWQFNPTAVTPDPSLADEPHMEINPKNGMVGFSFLNGTYKYAMPKNAENSFNRARYDTRDFMVSNTFVYDKNGNAYGCAAGQDSDDGKADPFWVFKGADTANGIEKTGQVGVRLDGYKNQTSGSTGKDSTPYNVKDKIKNPSMATYTDSSKKTYVYLAYYDSWNDEIRFRASPSSFAAGFTSVDAGKNTSISSFGNNNGYYECRNVQVIATTFSDDPGNDETPLSDLYTAHDTDYGLDEKGPLGGAGVYVSIDVVPSNGAVVIVWYDANADKTLYSYNTNPNDTSWQSDTVNKFAGLTHKNWAKAKVIFDGAGEFCQVKVDGQGGVHIAAYDSNSGDLRYAKLPAYNTAYNASTMSCVVDSKGVIGKQLTLDVVLEGTGESLHAVPYIGYVYESYPKLAHLVTTGVAAGADEEFFTGNWEVSYIPTPSAIRTVDASTPNDSRINVRLWKDGSGKIKDSKKTDGTVGTSSQDGNTGVVYGNGTSYPIMGYQVKNGFSKSTIETAQMR